MKNLFKTRIVSVLGIIALTAIIGFSMTACNDDDDGGDTTKFEGRWLNEYAVSDFGFTDFSYTFTGGKYSFNAAGNSNAASNFTNNGTFTFTDTKISFKSSERTWEQEYTLSGNVLTLTQTSGSNGHGPFTKQ